MRTLVICLALMGCTTPQTRVQTGQEVSPPAGYVALCEREPAAPECSR